MCAPMIPADQGETPTLRDKYDAEFKAMIEAFRVRHLLLSDLDEGAVSPEFGRELPDGRLKQATRGAFEAEARYLQAAHDLMHGEPYRALITSTSLAIAMQIRLSRNDKAAGLPVPTSRIPAVADSMVHA